MAQKYKLSFIKYSLTNISTENTVRESNAGSGLPSSEVSNTMVSSWLPTVMTWARSRGWWDLWWTKWRWSRFSPSTSVSPANLHSTNCWYKRPEVAAA
jgi:hypothetical protein